MSENIKIDIIDEFLFQWKERAKTHYKEVLEKISALNLEYSETLKAYNGRWNLDTEERKKIEEDHDKKWKAYSNYKLEYKSITNDVYGWGRQYWEERLEKVLNREVEAKKKTLINRIEKRAGKILDASSLYIGINGEINGSIKGDKTTVQVQTIYAGGYNIQCLHYRVLVK